MGHANLSASLHVTRTFTKGLNTLSHILDVAEAHAAANNNADLTADYLTARLIEDMRPLSFQIQNVTKTVKATLDRLTGAEGDDAKPWEDTETTWEEFRGRIEKAKKYVADVDRGVIDKRLDEGAQVDHPFGAKTVRIYAKYSALDHGVPNFYFHLATAYAILRAKGVQIGKRDWISDFLRPENEFPSA